MTIGVLGFLALIAVIAVVLGLGNPQERSYGFVTVDHPVDMWHIGDDHWAYYSLGEGTTADLAAKARPELLALGFQETPTGKPWFRFTMGKKEVVICDHSEFGVSSGSGGRRLEFRESTDHGRAPCVLVKNGLGTSDSLYGFQLKKLIHGW